MIKMKNYYDLTLRGKYQSCKKAITILLDNQNASNNEICNCLNNCEDFGLNDCNVENLRKAVLDWNKYRGYMNYCPLNEVKELL